MEAVSNVRTVVSLGREQTFVRQYVRELAPALKCAKRSAHCRGLVNGLSRSIFNFINATALTYGGHLIVSEGVRYENILVTTQSLQMASGQAQNAFTYAPEFEKGVSAASRIVALLESKPKICDPVVPLVSPFISKGEASFEEVLFKYPSRPGVRVLRGLDLKRLDGIPLPGLILSEARSCFGLVSQEPVLFDYSIEENIAYGDHERNPSHQDVVAAAMQANIHNFIVSLPQGYDTNIGPKGMQLSGGQKQRVAIARALIRHPKILLLDEATSALDTESEKVVQEALDAAKAGRTCVTIAHRLSTIRDADLICVLSKGRVAEAGTHQQLLEFKGLYYDLHANAN